MNAITPLVRVWEIIEWLARRRATLPCITLLQGSLYDRNGDISSLEQFVTSIGDYSGSLSDVLLVDFVISSTASAMVVVFDATDDITGLRYRFAWFVDFSGLEISEITAVYAQLAIQPNQPRLIAEWKNRHDATFTQNDYSLNDSGFFARLEGMDSEQVHNAETIQLRVSISRELIEWATTKSRDKPPSVAFAADFAFDFHGSLSSLSEFTSATSTHGGYSDVTHIQTISSESANATAVLLDATDIASNTRFRCAWIVRFASMDVSRVIQLRVPLPQPGTEFDVFTFV